MNFYSRVASDDDNAADDGADDADDDDNDAAADADDDDDAADDAAAADDDDTDDNADDDDAADDNADAADDDDYDADDGDYDADDDDDSNIYSGSYNDHHRGSKNDEPTDLWKSQVNIIAEEVIPRHFLKNALFTLVNKVYQKEIDLDIQNSSEDQVIIWAKHIYDFIENCLEQEELPSFFVPGANVFEKNYNQEQHIIMHVSYAGLDLCPTDMDVHLTPDPYQESEDTEDTMRDHLRKPFIKMLKGILQSHW